MSGMHINSSVIKEVVAIATFCELEDHRPPSIEPGLGSGRRGRE